MSIEHKNLTSGMEVAVEMPVKNDVLHRTTVFVKLPIEQVTADHITVNGKQYKRERALAYDLGSNSRIYSISDKRDSLTPSEYDTIVGQSERLQLDGNTCPDLISTNESNNVANHDSYKRIKELLGLLSDELEKKQ